jgi:OmpA-OmpF porin, OOP family
LLIALFSAIMSVQAQEYVLKFENVVKLDGQVNSDAEESMPVFSKDSSMLFFVRTFDKKSTGGLEDQDIWFSIKDKNGVYGKAQPVKELNNKLHNAVFGVNKDGSAIYLMNAYEGKKDMEKGIAISQKKGKRWQSPKKIDIPGLKIEGSFYGFHVNEEETAIIISYQGPGSLGKEDLYVCFRQNDGTWRAPMNLGPSLNSEYYEISPFLSPNMDTLYFTSDRPGGFGDGDVYFSIRHDDSWTNWSKPVNLGPVINTPRFDAFFIRSGNAVYWSSNRDNIRADIYKANVVPPVIPDLFASAQVKNVTEYGGSDGEIDLTIEGGVGPYKVQWSNGGSDEDQTGLRRGEYLVNVTDARGRTFETSVFVGEPEPVIASNREPDMDEELLAEKIYFDLNSSFFNKENRKTLNAIIPRIKQFDMTKIKIYVESHCDERDTDYYNMWLSERRMNRTVDYLVQQGIPRNIITGTFKGEREPDIKCKSCSEEEFTKNRRTYIIVNRK